MMRLRKKSESQLLAGIYLAALGIGQIMVCEVQAQDKLNMQKDKEWLSHGGAVLCAAFSPDGSSLVTGGGDGLVKIWETQTGTLKSTLAGHDGHVTTVAFSPDGRWIASADDRGKLRVWLPQTGKWALAVDGQSALNSVAFSPASKTLAVGSSDSTVLLYNTPDVAGRQKARVLRGHKQAVNSVVFSPDSESLASASINIGPGGDGDSCSVFLWDLTRGSQKQMQAVTAGLPRLAFSADSTTVACGAGGTVEFFDVRTGKRTRRFQAKSGVNSLALSPTGASLGGMATGGGKGLVVWVVDTQNVAWEIPTNSPVVSVAYSPNGKLLAAGQQDGTLVLWKLLLFN
jgi:WD40 repeat protein